jgi:hypothetical protein
VLAATLGVPIDIVASLSSTTTQTSENTTTLSFDPSSSDSLEHDSAADTTVQDASGITVPAMVVQDLVFQGVAVQDTDMHFPVPPATPQLMLSNAIPASFESLPVVRPGFSRASVRQNRTLPPKYVQQTGFGNLIVQQPSDTSAILARLRQIRTEASGRRSLQPVAPQRPGAAVPVSKQQTLQMLLGLHSSDPLIQEMVRLLQ